MLQKILDDLKTEVKFGYLKKNHPFRYPVLASIFSNSPVQRTVVLRDSTLNFDLLMYTDERSNKVKHFVENSRGSLLFYHPKKLLQIKISGRVVVLRSGPEYDNHWGGLQGRSIKDFVTNNPPGTPIVNPDRVSYKEDEHHFCLLKLIPDKMEYLQLKRPNHIRAEFMNFNDWEGSFLTP